MKHPDEKKLMLFFDKELKGEEYQHISSHISQCDDCRGRISQYEKYESILKNNIEETIKEEDFVNLYDEIKDKIKLPASKEPDFLEKLKIIFLDHWYFHKKRMVIYATTVAMIFIVITASIIWRNFPQPVKNIHAGSTALQVQFPNTAGTLYQMEENDGSVTTIIWIYDNTGLKKDKEVNNS